MLFEKDENRLRMPMNRGVYVAYGNNELKKRLGKNCIIKKKRWEITFSSDFSRSLPQYSGNTLWVRGKIRVGGDFLSLKSCTSNAGRHQCRVKNLLHGDQLRPGLYIIFEIFMMSIKERGGELSSILSVSNAKKNKIKIKNTSH